MALISRTGITTRRGASAKVLLCLATVVLGLVTSTARAQIAAFTEEAVARGVNYVTDFGSIAPWGFGLSLVDLDSDGDPDLITTGGSDQMIGIYENDGTGYFTERTYTAGLGPVVNCTSVVSFDCDGDGDLDLYAVCWNATNRLFRNVGSFGFVNITAGSGLADSGLGTGSCAGDYDGDGDMDIYLTNHTGISGSTIPNRLFRNNGNDTFTDVAPSLGVDVMFSTFQTVMTDIDRDGDIDIYVSNGKGGAPSYRENNLYENDGTGVFIDRTFTAGTAAYIDSMGVAVGDINADGYMDLYCTNVPFGNPLFINNQDGTFSEQSIPTGTASYRFGWGTQFLDFDNDTHLDLHVCNWNTGDRLYRSTGTWPLDDVADGLGLGIEGNSTCSAVADIDGDGDLDFVVHKIDSPVELYVNHEGEERHWLKVKLESDTGNRLAIGATIDVMFNGMSRTREIRAGDSYKSQNPAVQHFGLGDATVVDEIRVIWPGGLVMTYPSVAADQTITLSPTGMIETPFIRGDANGDLVVDVSDTVSTLEFLFLSGSLPCRDGGDANDDGTLDLSDAVYTLTFLFGGGEAPDAPFPGCGTDPTPDGAVPLMCGTGC